MNFDIETSDANVETEKLEQFLAKEGDEATTGSENVKQMTIEVPSVFPFDPGEDAGLIRKLCKHKKINQNLMPRNQMMIKNSICVLVAIHLKIWSSRSCRNWERIYHGY